MLEFFASFLASIVVAACLTWCVRNLASRFGLAKAPDSSRYIHSTPIPRLGGVAVFLAFLLLLGGYVLTAKHGWSVGPNNGDISRIVMLAAAFFLVGLVDDLVTVPPSVKLLVEIAGAVGLYFSGIRFGFCAADVSGIWGGAICLGLTVFWVVLVCNAINLIDGLD